MKQSVTLRHPDGTTHWEGVILDITEQQQAALGRDAAESERSALIEKLREQNETLHRQAEAMRELTTPIIPLASDVIALPLVGDIDPLRAQQILEALEGSPRSPAPTTHAGLVSLRQRAVPTRPGNTRFSKEKERKLTVLGADAH